MCGFSSVRMELPDCKETGLHRHRIDLGGRKDVGGMWMGENESAKFWTTVLNGLKNQGVEDIFIACTDNLAGFSAAIKAVCPKTEI